MKTTVDLLNSTLRTMLSEIIKLQTGATNRQVIAFTSCLGYSSPRVFGPHQTIIFDRVILNEGGSYDARHGVFRAPVSGVYQFIVTFIMVQHQTAWIEIIKDGVQLVYSWAGLTDYNTATAQVNVRVEAGQDVWCRNAYTTDATHLHNEGQYSCFSGHILS
ncbi:cerebellin-3-like [Saccostrea cucullata]|uniref:cerebellin-3-like n=1 Tax=Saccostrea cuccullata TaxID=36930 RepID=UPI002ED0E508